MLTLRRAPLWWCVVLASLPYALPNVISSASGVCNTDSSTGCVCSSNYDSTCSTRSSSLYNDNEECYISFTSTVELSVSHFNTESGYDRLSTDSGAQYGGTSGPNGVETSSLRWVSDGSITNTGFKVCATPLISGPSSPSPPPFPSPSPPPPSPAPPPPLPFFSSLSGSGCFFSDDDQCVASSSWPSSYDPYSSCSFDPPASESLYVAAFDLDATSPGEDALSFSTTGFRFTSLNPMREGSSYDLGDGVVRWSAGSNSGSGTGWKLCTQTFIDNGGDAHGGGGGGDSFDPIVLVAFIGVALSLGFWFYKCKIRSAKRREAAETRKAEQAAARRGFPSTTASGPAAGTAKFEGAVANDMKLDLRWEENEAKRERQRAAEAAEAEAKAKAYRERLEREERERKAEVDKFVEGYKKEVEVVVHRVTDQYEERARPPARFGRAAALRRELEGCLTNNKKLRACGEFAANNTHAKLSQGDLKEVLETIDYPDYRQHEICEALLPCLDYHATSYAKTIINPVNTI